MTILANYMHMGTQEKEPEELLQLSSDTESVLKEHNLRPLWEVEDDFGTVYDDLQADVWRWEDIQTAIDHIEDDVPIAELPPGFQRRVTVPINTGMDNAV